MKVFNEFGINYFLLALLVAMYLAKIYNLHTTYFYLPIYLTNYLFSKTNYIVDISSTN